jgi:ATP-dependent DNA helicase DinG
MPIACKASKSGARPLAVGRHWPLLLRAAGRKAEFEPLKALEDEVAAFAAMLETQAQRAEGSKNAGSAHRTAAAHRPVAEPERSQLRALGRGLHAVAAAHSTPLNVAEIFRKQMGGHPRAWIFTSATLAVQGKFHHYCAELGLGDPDSACWHSPFDYDKQAILYAPLGMPDPNAWNYTDAVVDAAWPAVKAANGGAFFLCTSLRAMRRTHELLKAKLEEENIDMPLLVQGEGSKNDLLQRFRHHGNSILVGSQSFWEASMCAARPCHWSSSTRSPSRRPMTRCSRRASSR